MIVTPSILVQSENDLISQITRLVPYYNHFQVDITDGELFPSPKTIQIEDVRDVLSTNYSLQPTNFVFDFHLMVKDYESDIKKLEELKKTINIDTILIHFSALKNYQLLTTNYSLFKIGIVLNPEDSVQDLSTKYSLENIPGIQIMSVSPGLQGNPFLPDTLNKIEQLRVNHYEKKIYLDGAINEETLPVIFGQKYRPDVIGPGSFFSKATDEEIPGRVKLLEKLLTDYTIA